MINPNVPITEAAKRVGADPETIRIGIRNGTFPIGCAVKSPTGRYTYIIPREGFENWLKTGFSPREIEARIDAFARQAVREAIKEEVMIRQRGAV